MDQTSTSTGVYLELDLKNTTTTSFCIGVAGYPEKHRSPESGRTCAGPQKVDHGAEYIITQMFFDNRRYFDFVDRCRDNGINVPIIPGIKP